MLTVSFHEKTAGHQMKLAGARLKTINNKMKWIFIEWVIEWLDSLPKGCCDC